MAEGEDGGHKKKLFNNVKVYSFVQLKGVLNRFVTVALKAFRPPRKSTIDNDIVVEESMLRSIEAHFIIISESVKVRYSVNPREVDSN